MLARTRITRKRLSLVPSGFYTLDDAERGQTVFRLWGGPTFLYVVLCIYLFGHNPNAEVALRAALAYNVMGVAWFYFISIATISADVRRKIVIFLDLVIWSVGFCLAGDIYALVIWMPLTVSMGNGLRYGQKYGFIAATVGGVCVGTALFVSPFWRSMPLVLIGIVLAVTIVPFYAFLLTKKIAKTKDLMEQRAVALESAIRFDPLTGVLNRTGFSVELEAMFSHTQLSGKIGALLVIDLDGFKAVNDAAGHAAGDAILRAVADRMRSCLRASDSIGRLGGDEFAVGLTSLQKMEDACAIAHKVIEAVAKLEVPNHPGLRVGASIGMCLLPHPDVRTIADALAMADARMYDSKRSGGGVLSTTALSVMAA